MTLEENPKTVAEAERMHCIGKLLAEILAKAQQERRVSCGMYRAAKIMEMDPSSILICILPQNRLDDVALHINHMLLEAYCFENEIPIVKVDCEEKLAALLQNGSKASGSTATKCKDYSCVIVGTHWNKTSSAEEKLLEFCQDVESGSLHPVVEIPPP